MSGAEDTFSATAILACSSGVRFTLNLILSAGPLLKFPLVVEDNR